jgi:hypothetical protein
VPNTRVLILLITLALVPQHVFAGGTAVDKQAQFMKALDSMMVELAAQTARASATVRKEYRAYLDLLVLDEYAALEDALYTGGLVPLPGDPERFNLSMRTGGPAPIAEKDLDNQASYIAARPATIGALLEVASRVKSGPIEITSLVRHSEYQDTLRTTNSNATTSVPMHTMGLAFDIALVNTPLARAYEIRNVLRRMQADGDLLVIGERKQLVFHVVPNPSRLGHFTNVYARAVAASLANADEIDAVPIADMLSPLAPIVETEVIEIRPTEDHAAEWWAADGTQSNLTVEVSAESPTSIGGDDRSFFARFAASCVAVVSGLVQSARDLLA